MRALNISNRCAKGKKKPGEFALYHNFARGSTDAAKLTARFTISIFQYVFQKVINKIVSIYS